jgi:hypothetical protein
MSLLGSLVLKAPSSRSRRSRLCSSLVAAKMRRQAPNCRTASVTLTRKKVKSCCGRRPDYDEATYYIIKP